MNNSNFSELEDRGYKITYAPLSETLWLFWQDYVKQNEVAAQEVLDNFKIQIEEISDCLLAKSPFENDLCSLIGVANTIVGYFSGAFGRYRQAKLFIKKENFDGIITVTSMYENTGIVMHVLGKGFETDKAVLNLTFDGNKNENDELKIESFIYYL